MVGERVVAGRYRLEQPVGAGGMGEVWRATDLELGRVVAMKRSHDDGGAGQIRREGRIAAGLHHANVISVFDTVVDGGTKWLVMEYLQARSLSEIVRTDGPLPPETAAAVGAQIASALAAMHERGMVHRDVTPANVLVTPGQVAKLTDFGISSWDELTVTGDDHVAGTPAYMAPEAAAGREVRFPADVFSLGALLYAAVEGRSPWGTRDRTPGELRTRAVAGDVTPPSRAGALTPVLTELLASNPAARPTAENARRMLNAVGGTTVPNEPIAAPARKRRRLWALAAGAAVVVVALAATAVATGAFRADEDTPVTGAGAVLDIRTADPCALMDKASLSGFGTRVVQLDSEYGLYNQCGLTVRLTDADKDLGYVALFLERIPDYEAGSRRLGELGPIEALAEDEGKCERRISLSDGNRARIVAHNQGARAAEPCDMADAVAKVVLSRLQKGPIPRREHPFPAASNANADACTLLTAADLTVAFGDQTPEPEPELDPWQCYWENDSREVSLQFSREWQEDPDPDDEKLPLGPWTATVGTRDEGCAVEIRGREYEAVTDVHDDWMEQTTLVLDTEDESVDPASLCSGAKVLAAAVAKRLPTG